MGPAIYDFQLKQGDTYTRKLTIREPVTLVGINLTGQVFKGHIRKTPTDPKVLASFNFVLRDQTLYPGQLFFSLTALQASLIPVNKALLPKFEVTALVYDIQRTLSDGVTVETVLQGNISLTPDATKNE